MLEALPSTSTLSGTGAFTSTPLTCSRHLRAWKNMFPLLSAGLALKSVMWTRAVSA
jgi:hypothetical protein